jgi:hypothetical protein
VLDPLTFLAALQFCFWLFEKFAKRQHRRSAKQLQTFMQRYQLPIYVFQIPLIFMHLAFFEYLGLLNFASSTSNHVVVNWTESVQTWALFILLSLLSLVYIYNINKYLKR